MSNNGTDTVRFIKDPHGNVVATSKNDKCRIVISLYGIWWQLNCMRKDLIVQALMQGDKNEKFNPKDNITKEQVIVTLLKLNEII